MGSPVQSHESLVRVGQPTIAQGDGIDVDAGAGVAGGDGKAGLEGAGVEGRQLFTERSDDQATVGQNVGNFRVELDVLHVLAAL